MSEMSEDEKVISVLYAAVCITCRKTFMRRVGEDVTECETCRKPDEAMSKSVMRRVAIQKGEE